MIKRITAALSGASKAAADVRGAVEGIRSDRLRLLDQRDEIENRATPRDEAIAAVDAEPDRLADAAVESMSIRSLMRPATSPRFDPNVLPADLFGLLIATSRDAVRDLIVGKIDDFVAAYPTMPATEKAAAIAAIDAELFELELAEEAAIRAAESAGLAIERREDADPQAVLAADGALQ